MFTSLTAKHLNFSITFISSVDFQMETTGFPFPDHAYFDDFTLLFSRGRLRNVQNFKPLGFLFCHVTVAVVVCLKGVEENHDENVTKQKV